jgi:hypothetical protein
MTSIKINKSKFISKLKHKDWVINWIDDAGPSKYEVQLLEEINECDSVCFK